MKCGMDQIIRTDFQLSGPLLTCQWNCSFIPIKNCDAGAAHSRVDFDFDAINIYFNPSWAWCMPWWIIVYLLYHPLLVNLFRFVGRRRNGRFPKWVENHDASGCSVHPRLDVRHTRQNSLTRLELYSSFWQHGHCWPAFLYSVSSLRQWGMEQHSRHWGSEFRQTGEGSVCRQGIRLLLLLLLFFFSQHLLPLSLTPSTSPLSEPMEMGEKMKKKKENV